MSGGSHLHFEPTSGIAGDMAVAALVDAGVPATVVKTAVAAMGVRGLRVTFGRRKRGAFVGRSFDVDLAWPASVGVAPARMRTGPTTNMRPRTSMRPTTTTTTTTNTNTRTRRSARAPRTSRRRPPRTSTATTRR